MHGVYKNAGHGVWCFSIVCPANVQTSPLTADHQMICLRSCSCSHPVLNNRFLTISDSQCVAVLLSLYYAEAVSRLTYAQRSPSSSRLTSPPSPSSLHLLCVYLSSVDCAGVPVPPRQHQTLFTLLLNKPEGAQHPWWHTLADAQHSLTSHKEKKRKKHKKRYKSCVNVSRQSISAAKSENKVIKGKQQLTGQEWKGVKELGNLLRQLYKWGAVRSN